MIEPAVPNRFRQALAPIGKGENVATEQDHCGHFLGADRFGDPPLLDAKTVHDVDAQVRPAFEVTADPGGSYFGRTAVEDR